MSPTPTNPTTLLREAASLLREAAGHATPGPWRTHDTHLGSPGGHTATVLTDRPNINDTELIAWLPTMSHEPWDETRNAWRNAGWMALMDPSVGLALADWLEAEAAAPITAQHSTRCVDPQCTTLAALTVARRVLGTPTTPPASGERPDHALYTTLRKYGHTPAEAQQMIDTYTQTILTRQGAPAADRATVLREAADTVQAMNEGCSRPKCVSCATRTDAADALRDSASRMAAEAQQPTGCTSAPCPSPGDCRYGCRAAVDELAREAQQPAPAETEETVAERTLTRWAVETYDPIAKEWAPGTRFLLRKHAVERLEQKTERTPVRRLVRETTTYTVEPEVNAIGEPTDHQPCACCKGSGADPEDPGDYDSAVHMHNPYTVGPCPECNGTGRHPAP